MNSWWWANVVSSWLLVPGMLVAAGGLGLLVLRRHPGFGRTLIGLTLAALWLVSMPWTARVLHGALGPAAGSPLLAAPAQAIVVLGGGQYHDAPEYGGDTVGDKTLMRLRYAARLYRQTGKPVLVSGGTPEGSPSAEATLMKAALETDFNVPVAWVETASNNTLENARMSRAILAPLGVHRVYLVTHAFHMPRAARAFKQAGFDVVPAATEFATHFKNTLIDFMPRATALRDSNLFMHEMLGIAWYQLKSMIN